MNVGTAVGVCASEGLAADVAVRDAVLDGGNPVVAGHSVNHPYNFIGGLDPIAPALTLRGKTKVPQDGPDAAMLEVEQWHHALGV